MCTRFRSIREWSELPRTLQGRVRFNFAFNPNVAPKERVPIVLAQAREQVQTVLGRFGIAMVRRDGKPRPPLLNVRTDGLKRGQFDRLLREQRCVVPCQGFYEWRDEEGKQPYYFSRRDGGTIMLAGIWNDSEHKGDRRSGFAILTAEPNELVAPYHDRMPLALADDKVMLWLDLAETAPLEQPLLLELDAFMVRPMNRAMNSVREKDLAMIEPEPFDLPRG